MNLSIETIKHILGIKGSVYLSPKDMARNLIVTFLPPSEKASSRLVAFSQKLKVALLKLGVKIIPFEKTFIDIPDVGKKIKQGIVVVATGDYETGKLPINYTYSFTENPIVSILDKPAELYQGLSYNAYMDLGLRLFTWHMCNIVIAVDEQDWMLFSFNGFSKKF